MDIVFIVLYYLNGNEKKKYHHVIMPDADRIRIVVRIDVECEKGGHGPSGGVFSSHFNK